MSSDIDTFYAVIREQALKPVGLSGSLPHRHNKAGKKGFIVEKH
jgi:hypothetical protein